MRNPHDVTTRIIDTTSGSVIEFGYNTWVSCNSDYQSVCGSYPSSIVTMSNACKNGKYWIRVLPVSGDNQPVDRPYKVEKFQEIIK